MIQTSYYNAKRTQGEALPAANFSSRNDVDSQVVKITTQIRRLIWLYFWLILFEGVLRKWLVPALAMPLLLVRDPIALYVYYIAYRAGLFPRNRILVFGSVIAWLSLAAGMLAMQESLLASILVPIYGFRANFLHLPLIFIIARCFTTRDVRRIGYWVLLLSLPMALLMAVQFQSSPTSFFNAGAGEGAKQIGLSADHVRASGTFSFVTGPIYFFSVVAAFLFDGFFAGRKYPRWLVSVAGIAVGLAAVTAGSRTLLGTVAIVAVCALITGTLLNPRLLFKTVQLAFVTVFTFLVLSQIPVFGDALTILVNRIDGANRTEGKGSFSGVVSVRVLDDFTRPLEVFFDAPLLGEGLGIGTVVGSVLSHGGKMSVLYRDAERELARNVLESGPILGMCFILLRWSIIGVTLSYAVRCARGGQSLPFLLVGISGFIFLNGNLGQTTTMGFGVFVAGLCLAKTEEETPDGEATLALSTP